MCKATSLRYFKSKLLSPNKIAYEQSFLICQALKLFVFAVVNFCILKRYTENKLMAVQFCVPSLVLFLPFYQFLSIHHLRIKVLCNLVLQRHLFYYIQKWILKKVSSDTWEIFIISLQQQAFSIPLNHRCKLNE